jgi:hypothetical protein
MDQVASKPVSAGEQKDLAALIGASADAGVVSNYLDGLDPAVRVREVQGLSRGMLPPLFALCEKGHPLSRTDIVADSVSLGQTVIFAGANNLPLFRYFEKRFTRTKEGAVIGFNFQSMSSFTGPGYFTVQPSNSELLFDYTTVPAQEEVPADWPKVRPNNRGLSNLVYKDLHDFCRRVSPDVIIGHATRLGESMPQYFVLVRRPAPQ